MTEEQEKELEALGNMKEEDIDTDDIPATDFYDAEFNYSYIKFEKNVSSIDTSEHEQT